MTEYNDQITFKISDERLQWIEDQVELRDSNRSEIIRRSLDVAEKATLDYSGDGEASRERVEELEQEAQSLRYKLQRREQEIERLENEIDEKTTFQDEWDELSRLVEAIAENMEMWTDALHYHRGELEEFEERIDELEATVETETSAVRSGLGEQVEPLETVAENAQETIEDERGERYAYWNERLDELSDQLNSVITDVKNVREDVQADLDEIREEVEDDDDGGSGLF